VFAVGGAVELRLDVDARRSGEGETVANVDVSLGWGCERRGLRVDGSGVAGLNGGVGDFADGLLLAGRELVGKQPADASVDFGRGFERLSVAGDRGNLFNVEWGAVPRHLSWDLELWFGDRVAVFCLDLDEKKIAKLNAGQIPIFEPGLQELMQENYASGQIQFTESVKSAVKDAEVVFLAVGTPSKPDGTVDMSYLEGAGKEVCDALAELNNDYMVTIIVNRSWLSAPIDRPMVATITSVEPRAFMPVASASDSRRDRPPSSPPRKAPVNFPIVAMAISPSVSNRR
jgi:hypothetical protein